ncbi:MAG TPA: hypothetical protein VJS66_07990 [Burkholderiales bacterium]|nr:hypothetical protein [Burkholderiales bacterium]
MKQTESVVEAERRIAEAVRQLCIQAARRGYRQAAESGLCDEGALEAAIGAMQMLDLNQVVLQEKQ